MEAKVRNGVGGTMNKDFGMTRLFRTVFYRVFASVYESVAMVTEQQVSTIVRKFIFKG